jgi:uncharacterized protein with HEPN domain
MPSKRANPKAYLYHIRDNITLARSFIEGFDYERFRDNQLVFYAVMRALEVISEASRRLPVAMKARRPEIPWQDVAGGLRGYGDAISNPHSCFTYDASPENSIDMASP